MKNTFKCRILDSKIITVPVVQIELKLNLTIGGCNVNINFPISQLEKFASVIDDHYPGGELSLDRLCDREIELELDTNDYSHFRVNGFLFGTSSWTSESALDLLTIARTELYNELSECDIIAINIDGRHISCIDYDQVLSVIRKYIPEDDDSVYLKA